MHTAWYLLVLLREQMQEVDHVDGSTVAAVQEVDDVDGSTVAVLGRDVVVVGLPGCDLLGGLQETEQVDCQSSSE